jgi:translocation and assembly module TamA
MLLITRWSLLVCLLAACGGCASLRKQSTGASTANDDAKAVTSNKPASTGAAVSTTTANSKTPSKIITKLLGIDDKATRSAVLRAIELRSFRKREVVTEAQVQRLFDRAPKQIEQALEPFGYYNAKVVSALRLDGSKWRAQFDVQLGPRVIIKTVNFQIDGPAGLDERVARSWRKLALKTGEPLDHARYELAKNDLQRVLLERGYLDADLLEHRVEVSRAESTAVIVLKWQSGVRYAYGTVQFTGAQFSPAFMERYVNFSGDDFYTQKRLLDLQEKLLATDYFSSVEIAPETEELADGKVPISIILTPAKRSVYTYGVNVGTDSGFGVRGALERRWVNDRGHKFRSGVDYSQRLKAGTLSYDIPMPDKARTTYGLNLSYRDEKNDILEARLMGVALRRTKEWKLWQQTLAINWLNGDFEVGGEEGNSTLFYPELIMYRRNADDLLYPRDGYSVTLNARGGGKGLLSDTSFANVSGELRYIKGIGEKSRLLTRAAFGALWTEDFQRLPPELRFFAGGDRSIRGYRYQDLAPVNASNRVRGGRYLAVASGEYEYAWNDQYAVAAFVDVGNAFDSFTNLDSKIGAGLGLRWRSPVGVVRLDVGFALDEPSKPARLHLVIGPDL